MDSPVILVFQGDAFSANAVESHVSAAFPDASCHVTTCFEQAERLAVSMSIDLFIAPLETANGDLLDLLLRHTRIEQRSLKVLITAPRCPLRALLTLKALGVLGLFDSATDRPAQIEGAMREILLGRRFWSATFSNQLTNEQTRRIRHQLSPAEQLGLAVFGDGCGDFTAANLLGMQHSSVRSLRKRIHAKIGAHDKEDMMRTAARLGFTRFGADGLVPMGLGMLALEYIREAQRPMELSSELLEACGLTSHPLLKNLDAMNAMAVGQYGCR